MILFCTDDRCSYPMHILTSDVIDRQGARGSVLLIRLLNRMGVCSSSDILAKFINNISNKSCLLSNKALMTESFAVVSADNLDYLHSYARVCKHNRKKQLAWYFRTTGATKTLTLSHYCASQKMQGWWSRRSIPWNKAKHRQRTGTEGTEQSATTQSNPCDVLPSIPTKP